MPVEAADLRGCLRELRGVQLELKRRRADFVADADVRTLAECERHVEAARARLENLQRRQRLVPNAYQVNAYLGRGPETPKLPKVLWRTSRDPETQSLSSASEASTITNVGSPRSPHMRHPPEATLRSSSRYPAGWGDLSDSSSTVSSEHEDLTRHGDFDDGASSVVSLDDLSHLRE